MKKKTDKEKITEWLNDSIAASNHIRELFSSEVPQGFYRYDRGFFKKEELDNLSRPFVPVGKLKEVIMRDPHYGDYITVVCDERGNMLVTDIRINLTGMSLFTRQ